MAGFGATVGAGILSQGVTEILKGLSIFVASEIALAWGVNDELQNLKENLNMMLGVMVDAENKQVKSMAVRGWLEKLKDIAYEAEDILDEHAYEGIRQQEMTRKRDRVSNFFSPKNSLVFRQKVAHAIKKINKKLIKHAVLKNTLGLEMLGSGPMDPDETSKLRSSRNTESGVDVSLRIIGRDKDKSNIIKMLLHDDQDENIQVIPIVGMGGVGKTTLAQSIYNTNTVKNHFGLNMWWVCVSDDFNVEKLFVKIIESITRNKCEELSNTDVLITDKLEQRLSGKKYLLVLDDVWNKKQGEWGRLRKPLLMGGNGSKILITTRSEEVASIMGGQVHSYTLGILDKDQSWSLFHERMFGRNLGAPMETPTLTALGKELVEKCGGLPLALIFLIGLLRNKDENEWRIINEDKIWVESNDDQDEILPILKLSYDRLPSHLKLCFSYFSLFGKDYPFHRKAIILLWMAEGFLPKPSGGNNISMEELGNKYFNSLLRNSFFQDVRKDEFEQVTFFKMHDLVHDLAKHVAGDRECCVFYSDENMGSISNVRRLQLCILFKKWKGFNEIMTVGLHNNPKLRTLLVYYASIKKIENNVFDGTKRLRVLDLSGALEMEEISSASMKNLKHLRYLDLSGTKISNLPESVMSLYHLQTLILSGCENLKELPKGIEKLINLRHLLLPDDINMPREIGQLSSLQTLEPINVGRRGGGGGGGGCGIENLEGLNLLNGVMVINQLFNVTSGTEAQRANLGRKKNLNTIFMNWRHSAARGEDDCGSDEAVLEALQPHPNLKILVIKQYFGVKLPRWMGDASYLPNLVILCLDHCTKCKQLVGFGRLPYLKDLRLFNMDGIKCLGKEFYYNNNDSGGGGGGGGNSGVGSSSSSSSSNTDGEVVLFPSLKELFLSEMCSLEEWVDIPTPTIADYSCFPCLEKLNIHRCPNLRITPTRFPSLQELTLVEINERLVVPLITTNVLFLKMAKISGLMFLPQSILLEDCVAVLNVVDCLDFQGFTSDEEVYHQAQEEGFTSPEVYHQAEEEGFTSVEEEGFTSPEVHHQAEEEGFTSVVTLSLLRLPALKFLPDIRRLTSLEYLFITDCESFKPSPEDLECLPSSLEHLKVVQIRNVKDVEEFIY